MIAPKLRFSEFKDEWIKTRIGESFQLISGFAFPSSAKSNSDGAKWLKIADVGIQKMNPSNLSFLPKQYLQTYSNFIVKKDDYVVALTRPILNGELKISQVGDFYDNALLNQRVAKLASEDNNLKFIYCLLQKSETVKDIENSIAGTDPPNLSLNEIKDITISLPTVEEQTKIAEFLSAVDDKISQLSRQLELLNQYKKGVMQKIFSQEIRFKNDNGEDFGEWVETNLNKISNHIGGTALESFVSLEADYKFISIGNYSTNGNYIDNGQRIELNDKTQAKLLNKNDLVMVLNDKTSTGDLIGSTLLIDRDNEYIYNQRSERIICNLDLVNPKFLWHYLNSFKMRDEIKKLAQGGTQIYINFSSVLGIGILLPLIQEQEKIAEFLTAIDERIDHTTAQLTHTKQWKKGLLQQMFV